MRGKPFLASLTILLALGGVLTFGQQADTAGAALHALFDREWEWELAADPVGTSYLGDTRFDDHWPDLSLKAFADREAHREAVLQELAGISRDTLSDRDKVNYDVFKYQYEMAVEGYRHHYYLIRTNTYDGVQNAEQVVDAIQFDKVKAYDNWLARLDKFPEYIDQNIELMRQGMKDKVLLPKVIVEKVEKQLADMAALQARESGYYRPFLTLPENLSSAEKERLTARGLQSVRTRVEPALQKMHDFIEKEYLPAANEKVGWSQNANGLEDYAFLARYHTTTDLTPQQIHEMGLKEVARIRGEMEKIKDKVGFKGTMQEFFTYLRTDPKFYFKTPQDLLDGYRVVAKRIDPELLKITRKMPRMPWGIIPVPDAVAPNTTTAYANFPSMDGTRPAYMFVNLYKPEVRPKWEMMSLTLHEGMPGHCLQGSVALELGEMPAFRRNASFTAYVEGWALYAESLGDEMGLYRDDPYAKFGNLTYEMWRAVRLVVDTGMHTMGWDRDRAIKYFMDNAAKTQQDVTNEIDRYISWPGQALAYKVGQMKIWELRHKAEAALGDKFDVRDFNDVILQTGAVPLNVLEQHVNEWIASTH